ncbi:hypothetical protein HYS97_02700 [Candidatus Daviesbacteria bacterium]|nr:hypothetical protein [Candidatus Daviesbacteria bacterium]
MPFLKRLLYAFVFGIVFFCVIFFVNPPKSWTQASYFQILIFFIPLLLFFTFFVNIFLNYLPRSFAISIGLLIIVVLQALGQLNYLYLIFIAFAISLLVWFIPKSRAKKKFPQSSNKFEKIPKLSSFRRKR